MRKKKSCKTSNKAERRRLVWNPSRRRMARLPQNPLVKIYTLNSKQSKRIFTIPLSFFFDEVCILTKMKTRENSASSPLKHFLESTRTRPTLASYKINYPWSQETVKLDQVWLLLSSDAFVINILVWFFFFHLVRYSEDKDDSCTRVHSETRVMWPSLFWSTACDPNYCYRQHGQRERSAPSPNKLWHHGEKCASVSYICLKNSRTFLSYHISNRCGENPSSQFSYKSTRQVAAVTILLTLKMLNIKIKLISSVWILLNPVKHVSSVTSILFTS